MADVNYVCCRACSRYMPLHHPDAVAWQTNHGESCKQWREIEPPKDLVKTVTDGQGNWETAEVPLVMAWTLHRENIFFTPEPPPVYECAVGPVEELAYGVPPEEPKL